MIGSRIGCDVHSVDVYVTSECISLVFLMYDFIFYLNVNANIKAWLRYLIGSRIGCNVIVITELQ